MNAVKEAINSTSIRILEEWALMLVEPSPFDLSKFSNEPASYCARIKFEGIISGEYQIFCQKNFARNLANNLLGLDREAESSELVDGIREMANVLAGNLLTECYGTDVVFSLSLPEVSEVESETLGNLHGSSAFMYLADGEPVIVSFELVGLEK